MTPSNQPHISVTPATEGRGPHLSSLREYAIQAFAATNRVPSEGQLRTIDKLAEILTSCQTGSRINLSGLSGTGKSELLKMIAPRLQEMGIGVRDEDRDLIPVISGATAIVSTPVASLLSHPKTHIFHEGFTPAEVLARWDAVVALVGISGAAADSKVATNCLGSITIAAKLLSYSNSDIDLRRLAVKVVSASTLGLSSEERAALFQKLYAENVLAIKDGYLFNSKLEFKSHLVNAVERISQLQFRSNESLRFYGELLSAPADDTQPKIIIVAAGLSDSQSREIEQLYRVNMSNLRPGESDWRCVQSRKTGLWVVPRDYREYKLPNPIDGGYYEGHDFQRLTSEAYGNDRARTYAESLRGSGKTILFITGEHSHDSHMIESGAALESALQSIGVSFLRCYRYKSSRPPLGWYYEGASNQFKSLGAEWSKDQGVV